MLGVGWTEMLVIGIVALIVIGPKDLPAMMHRVGKFAASIRKMGSEFQRELNKTTGLNEIANLRNSVTAPLRATADAIRKEFNTTTATGEVKPSGVLKPTEPEAESVVNEIRAKAGLPPIDKMPDTAPAMTPLTGPANPVVPVAAVAAAVAPAASIAAAESPAPPETRPARVRAARVPKVVAAPIEPVAPAPKARKPKKSLESPAPVEAIAPKPRRRSTAVAAPVETPDASPVAAKPAARRRTTTPRTP